MTRPPVNENTGNDSDLTTFNMRLHESRLMVCEKITKQIQMFLKKKEVIFSGDGGVVV